MIDRLTNIESKLNKIILYYCLILAAGCLLLAFSSCSNMRSIKSKSGGKVVKLKSTKDYKNIDTLSDEIFNFEEKVLTNKTSAKLSSVEDTDETNSMVFDVGSKRLPTLREQMQTLSQDQEHIKSKVNHLQEDVNEIKNSIDDIKDAISVMNFNSRSTPLKGPQTSSKPDVIESTEEDYDYEDESDNSIIKSDEAVKKAPAKPKVQNKPKAVQTKPAANNSINHNSKPEPVKAHPKNEIKPEPNNYKLAANEVNAGGKNLNQNVESALSFFAKKDYHKAINELNSILIKTNDEPTHSLCHYWLGESYFRLGNYDEANKFFNKSSLEVNSPKAPEALIMVGESNIRLGKIEAARTAFEAFLNKYPGSRFSPRAKKMLQQL